MHCGLIHITVDIRRMLPALVSTTWFEYGRCCLVYLYSQVDCKHTHPPTHTRMVHLTNYMPKHTCAYFCLDSILSGCSLLKIQLKPEKCLVVGSK